MQENTTLVQAHIIPRFLFAQNSLLISGDRPFATRRQRGPYDQDILCGSCDNSIIGSLEKFAKEVLMDGKGINSETVQESLCQRALNVYRLEEKTGYSKLARFFISILWRASVSMHMDFSAFNLGPYEHVAKQAILESSYDYSRIFSVSLCRISDLSEPVHVFSNTFTRIDGVNFYIHVIGFFKVMIKCDKRQLPARLQAKTLSAENDILMPEANLSFFPESQILHQMAQKIQHNKKH